MKSTLYIVLICCFFLVPSWASDDLSDKPIIDEDFRKIELEIQQETEACRNKEKSVIKKLKCGDRAWKQNEKEGNLRGTDEYCRKHYSNLDDKQLYSLWKKLKEQRSKARINPSEDIPGEVTEVMFKIEESWVEDQLAQRRKGRIKALGKELYEETEKGRGE